MEGFIMGRLLDILMFRRAPQKTETAEKVESYSDRLTKFGKSLNFAERFPIPQEVLDRLDELPVVPRLADGSFGDYRTIPQLYEDGTWARLPWCTENPADPNDIIVTVIQIVPQNELDASQWPNLSTPLRGYNRHMARIRKSA